MEAATYSAYKWIKRVKGIKTTTQSGDGSVTGASVDRLGYGSCLFSVHNGDATGTPTSYTVDGKLQDSADGSAGWADISGATITQLTADNSLGSKGINLAAVKRYIRLVATVDFTGGTSPGVPVGGDIVLCGPDVIPAA